jgi:hypothetical protein
MTKRDDLPPPQGPAMSATELRRRMAEIELAKMEEADAKRRALEEEQMAQVREFLEGRLTADDLERIRHRIAVAVENGQLEVEVLRFPSSVLADKGRAINNADPEWPQTLRGKAADVYAIYEERAAPLGYKLHARILNYPGGLPGEAGLFLNWG